MHNSANVAPNLSSASFGRIGDAMGDNNDNRKKKQSVFCKAPLRQNCDKKPKPKSNLTTHLLSRTLIKMQQKTKCQNKSCVSSHMSVLGTTT